MSKPQTNVCKRRDRKNMHAQRRPALLRLEHLEERLTPSTANANFVTKLYKDVLNRAPDAGGLAGWTAGLDSGFLSTTQAALGFTTSPEYDNILVADAYALLLKRAPDPAGQQAWVAYLVGGGSQSPLFASIAASSEYFQTQAGGTNAGFVTALYRDALGRVPDAGGEAFWDGQLAAGESRFRVALGFFNSAEYDTDLVESYYQKFLNRPADPGGLSNWVGQLENGATDEGVMAAILGSQESFALSQTAPPATATVVVTPPANQTNNEGETVSGVTVTATGGDGNPFTFSASNLPPGLTINATTGVISGTLTSAGTFTVDVAATDGANTGSASFTWTVNSTSPVVTPPATQNNDEGDVVSGVTVTATGGDGNPLTFSATNLPPGLTINATTGVISGTLTGQSAGNFTVDVSATDGTNTGSANFQWNVTDITTPVVTPPADQTNNVGDVVSGVTVTATDADGDTLTFGATNLPPGLTIDPTTGVISGTLTSTSAGTFTVGVTATDGFNTGSSSFTWTVNNPSAPVVTPPANQTNKEGDTVSGVFVTATGGDGNPLTYGATNLPPGLSINATTGEISGTLAPGSAGTYTVDVSATDGANTGNASFTWTVNANTPVVTPPADQTNNEGDAVSGVTVTATGGDGNPLTFAATNLPPGLTIDPTTGVISGTLTGQSAGTYTVDVSATDGTNTGSATFQWTVNDITTPVVTPPADQTNNAGDTVSGVTVTATDADGDTLTFGATNLPSGLTINPTTGVISGTLSATSGGTFTVTVSASDGFNTGTATFTWTVNDANAPTVTPPSDQTNNEGDVVNGVTVTATGGDGNPLTFSATNLPPGLTINSTTGVISGTLTTTSAGTYTVEVEATDGTNTGSASFTWTVSDVETPVVTPPADQTNNAGDTVSGVTVTATGGDGNTLTFGATNLPPGLSIDPTTGVISGTLSATSGGIFTVVVSASDGTSTGTADFTWTVNNPNAPTVTPPSDQNNNEGDTVTGVTVTATGGDGSPLTFSATNLPAGLVIDPATGIISGTLTGQSAGIYMVDVSATDGTNTGNASFTWTVKDVTAPAVTPPAHQTNNEGDTVTGVAVIATDADGDTLTYRATNLPPGLTINSTTGVISGTLTAMSAGTYTVTVRATDGFNTGTATFTWTVNNPNAPTVTAPANQTNNEGDTVGGLFVTATGGDGNPLTFSAVNLPPGLSINATTGEITGTLASGSAGVYTITVSASDGDNVGYATFQWTVLT